MKKLRFVDAKFHQLSETDDKSERYAIDFGISTELGDRRDHCFVSAVPWLKNADRGAAMDFKKKLEELNPNVYFELLSIERIKRLNLRGARVGFEIRNCWTRSKNFDYFGPYSYYLLKNGRIITDPGKEKTDVYFVFWTVSGQEKAIVMP